MAKETKNLKLYLEDDSGTDFKNWRDKMNGPEGSNMEKIDDAVASKQDKLTGTQGQVVGFDKDGNPVAQSTESLRGTTAYQYAVEGGSTGTEDEFKSLMGLTGTIATELDEINGEEV